MNPRIQRSNTLRNGLLLGWKDDKDGTSAPLWDTGREGHLITVAPTGAGKGVSCAIPALLTWQGPAIVIDPRGENFAVTAARRRAMGHLVHRLDPFGVAGSPDTADSLNPMDLIDPDEDDFEDNAAVVAQLCRQDMTDSRSPYWDERATSLITKIICAHFRRRHAQRPILHDVQVTLQSPSLTPLFGATPNPQIHMPHQAPYVPDVDLQELLSTAEFASGRTLSCIVSSANSHLGFLRSAATHASISDSTIQLDDITGGAMHTIYLIIPPDKLATHSSLLRLWIGVMLAAIARRRRAPKQPTLFLIDEAAQLGAMNELRSALTLMRAYGVRVWTFWQCISQLKNVYPSDWASILNNSSVQMFFGAKSPHSRKLLADFIGDAMPARGLPPNQQLLFDGDDFAPVRRANYLTDPLLSGLASPHPFHITDDSQPVALH